MRTEVTPNIATQEIQVNVGELSGRNRDGMEQKHEYGSGSCSADNGDRHEPRDPEIVLREVSIRQGFQDERNHEEA